MDDFNALASSLAAGLGDVRGCLILSRDGLVLGSSPGDAEASVTPAWVRFAALGDTERGFAQFGAETWCYVRRGPYGAFAIAGPGARPGLVLDQMDQALLAAEEARTRHDVPGARAGEISAPTSRPRTHLHPEPHHGKEPVVIDVPRNEATFADPPKEPPAEAKDDLGFGAFPVRFVRDPQAPTPDTQGPTPDTPAEVDTPIVAGSPSELDSPAEFDTPVVTDAPAVHDSPGEFDPRAEFDPQAQSDPQAELDTPVVPDSPAELGPYHDAEPADEAPPSEPVAEPDPPAWGADEDPWEASGDERDDVDRFSLAQEFGQLLQRGEDPADG